MSNNDGKNPMPNDKGKAPMFTAFENLSLHSNYSHFERGESSTSNSERGYSTNSNINNQNLNFYHNLGSIFLGSSRLSAAGALRAPPSSPSSRITPPAVFSSTNSGQPSAYPQSFSNSEFDGGRREINLGRLLNLMKSPMLYPEFLSLLGELDTHQAAKRERTLLNIGTLITTNHCTFLGLAMNQNGSRAIRALLQRIPSLDGLIFDAVSANFRWLMYDRYGRYLIVPTIRAVDKPRKDILFRLTYCNALSLATDETGCVALNDVFQEIRGRFRDLIFDLVARNAGWLSFDPYGTHVVQNFLTLQNPLATQAIANTLYGKFFRLAAIRHGSYVVEKCLKSEFGRDKVLDEFRGDHRNWVRMANDKFGNFVAQCALRVMKQRGMKLLLREFVEKLRPHFREMKLGHGKNTLRVIEEEIEHWIRGFPE